LHWHPHHVASWASLSLSHCRRRDENRRRAFTTDRERWDEREREGERELWKIEESRALFRSSVLFSSSRGYCCPPPAAVLAHYPRLSLSAKRLRQCGQIKRAAWHFPPSIRDDRAASDERAVARSSRRRIDSNLSPCYLEGGLHPSTGLWTVGKRRE
jgi:hypothetical protein